eukprot:CAMPEP_0171132824 /NCGR_PEP_ID=MMETSP0766_2-20121228/125211_1 /TAXON_ID=439317 /ORGANISM="Gambierdiscus australes, Strain CAWD 149" /LENGTH=31 /DNA_ID= /DNA_START= /DNA_END= /DNA_ORIENTATION=
MQYRTRWSTYAKPTVLRIMAFTCSSSDLTDA